MTSIIETYGYARAGFLGNPSDGYFGKTISFAFQDFRARALLYPSARLEIKFSKADLPIFEDLEDLYRTTRWRGYYGGIRIIQALVVRFMDYCREQGIALPNRNFTLEYESNIPQRLGLGGSSAISRPRCEPSASTLKPTSPFLFKRTWCWKPKPVNWACPRGCRTGSFRHTKG